MVENEKGVFVCVGLFLIGLFMKVFRVKKKPACCILFCS